MNDIDLRKYTRKDLSNFLQIAQQADNAGHPLPCWVVEQVVVAHDRFLNQPPTPAVIKRGTVTDRATRKAKIGAIPNKFCKTHNSTALHRNECGKVFCPDCLDLVT